MTPIRPTETTTITYKKITVPNRAGRYEFGISSTTVGDGHTATVNPHSTAHSIEALDAEDPPAGYHDHRPRSAGVISIEVEPHDHATDRTHEHGDDDHVINTAGHDHATTQDHGHDTTDKTVALVDGHQHPHSADLGQHNHHETSGLVTTAGLHSHSDNDANDGTHVHGPDSAIFTQTTHTHPDDVGAAEGHIHDDDGTVKDISTSHRHATSQDGDSGDHEHGTDGTLTRADTHTTVHSHDTNGEVSSPGANHMHGVNGNHDHDANANNVVDVVAIHTLHGESGGTNQVSDATDIHTHGSNSRIAGVSAHTHDSVGNDMRNHEHSGGGGGVERGETSGRQAHTHDAAGGISQYGTGVNTDGESSHSHDGDGTITNVYRTRYTGTLGTRVMGHTHVGDAGYTRAHQHNAAGIIAAPGGSNVQRVPEHTSHGVNYLNTITGVDVHTHDAGGVTGNTFESEATFTAEAHTHGSGGRVVVVTPHTHSADTVSVTVGAHSHDSGDADHDTERTEIFPVTSHTHAAATDDPAETVTVTATAHTHESDGIVTVVTAHTDDGTTVDITVPAHEHGEGEHTADNVIYVTRHTHDADDRGARNL